MDRASFIQVVDEYGPEPLDALFVSHFDRDHINGLSTLLNAFGGARNAFLPYLTPNRRLISAARMLSRGRRSELSDSELAMFDDPAGWLLAQGVERAVYVYGDDGVPFSPAPDAVGGLDVPVNDVSEVPPTVSDHDRVRSQAPGCLWMSHRHPIAVTGTGAAGWVFQTYVDPDPELESAINQAVRQAMGRRNYWDLCHGSARCADILRDNGLRGRLVEAYKKGSKAAGPGRRPRGRKLAKCPDDAPMNRTTMSVFSGPLWLGNTPSVCPQWSGDALRQESCRRLKDFPPASPSPHRCGWLLLGDATLAHENVLKRFRTFFGSGATPYLAQAAAFTVPHHGSKGNFSQEVLDCLAGVPIAVIPARRQSQHHPSEEVKKLLNGLEVAHVHNELCEGLTHKLVVRPVVGENQVPRY